MTSNLGSSELLEGKISSKEEILRLVEPILRKHFKPEFLNRLDEILPFIPLQEKDMQAIVKVQLDRVKKRLGEQSIELDYLPTTISYLAKKGYDPLYGARPLKRLIQNEVTNLLSAAILEHKISPSQTVSLDVKEDKICIT